jgi:hypothetical protein
MIIACVLYAILGVVLSLVHVSTLQYVGITALVIVIDVWSHYCAKTGRLK